MPLKRIGEDNNFQTEEEGLFDKKVFTVFQKAIQKEMEPIYRAVHEIAGRMKRMEERIADIEKHYVTQSSDTQSSGDTDEKVGAGGPAANKPTVIYQEFNVERLFIDKFDQTTTLGSLGIRELSGHLTIGTTYESEAIPSESAKEMDEDYKNMKEVQGKFSEKKKMVEEGSEKE